MCLFAHIGVEKQKKCGDHFLLQCKSLGLILELVLLYVRPFMGKAGFER